MSVVKSRTIRGIRVLTLDNPPVNAISYAVLEELAAAIDACRDNAAVEGVVITGRPDGFAAGADLPSFLTGGMAPADAIRRGVEVFLKVESLPKPVVAAIAGYCLGGGLELAMAADLRVASQDARFGQPEVRLGIIPGWNGTVRLPRLVGVGIAAEIILTGAPMDAERALQVGLVNRVVEPALLVDTSINLARQMANQSPNAVAAAKRLLALGATDDARQRELETVLALMEGPDAAEGLTAFVERRRPRFREART